MIGSHADIESARVADVRDFHQQYYTPNNASIAIAGDFDPKALSELLTKYFGPIPRGPEPPPVNVTTPPITSQKRATVTDTVKLPQIRFAWLTPPAYTQGCYDTDAAIYALGGAKASRLDEALVYKSQIAQSVNCGSDALKLTGMAQCIITARPGVKLEDIEAVFWKELQRAAAGRPDGGRGRGLQGEHADRQDQRPAAPGRLRRRCRHPRRVQPVHRRSGLSAQRPCDDRGCHAGERKVRGGRSTSPAMQPWSSPACPARRCCTMCRAAPPTPTRM